MFCRVFTLYLSPRQREKATTRYMYIFVLRVAGRHVERAHSIQFVKTNKMSPRKFRVFAFRVAGRQVGRATFYKV